MEAINLFDFTSHQRFLEAVFKSRRAKNPNYSMRKFSSDLGFSSPRYASVIINGSHKISDNSLEKICTSLKLKGKKKEYFYILVQIANCKEEEKPALLKKALGINHSLSGLVLDDSLGYYLENSACRHITLLVQIFGEEFIAEPLWIARHLRSDVPLEQISRALNYLIKYNFIKKVDGAYINSQNNIVTKDEIPSHSIKKAQVDLLKEANDALKFSLEEREYGNISVPLAKDILPQLKEKLKKNRDELKMWINNRNKEVSEGNKSKTGFLAISINFQMYPITKSKS